METTGDHGAHRSPVLQGQLASLETMEGHGRPWENTACQGPPGTARASGKAGDHRRETTGDQNVPKSTGRGKNIWEISDGNLRETTVCKGPLGAARATGKMGDQGESGETTREDRTTRETTVCWGLVAEARAASKV